MKKAAFKNVGADELDRSLPYPVHIIIKDDGTEYKISVSDGFMVGKVEPFSVLTTIGLRRRIDEWMEINYARYGLRLGFIHYTTVSKRHPRCENCKHGTLDAPMMRDGRRTRQQIYCDKCGGAGVTLPGFMNRN